MSAFFVFINIIKTNIGYNMPDNSLFVPPELIKDYIDTSLDMLGSLEDFIMKSSKQKSNTISNVSNNNTINNINNNTYETNEKLDEIIQSTDNQVAISKENIVQDDSIFIDTNSILIGINDNLEKTLTFMIDTRRDEKLKTEEDEEKKKPKPVFVTKITKRKKEIEEKFPFKIGIGLFKGFGKLLAGKLGVAIASGVSNIVTTALATPVLGAAIAIGGTVLALRSTIDSINEIKKISDDQEQIYQKSLTEAQKLSTSRRLVEKEESAFGAQRQSAMSALENYRVSTTTLDKAREERDQKISDLSKLHGVTKEEIEANQDKYDELVKINNSMKTFTESIKVAKNTLNGIDEDLIKITSLYTAEINVAEIKDKMKEIAKLNPADYINKDEYINLQKKLAEEESKVFKAKTLEQFTFSEGLSKEQSKQFEASIRDISELQMKANEAITNKDRNLYLNAIEAEKHAIEEKFDIDKSNIEAVQGLLKVSDDMAKGISVPIEQMKELNKKIKESDIEVGRGFIGSSQTGLDISDRPKVTKSTLDMLSQVAQATQATIASKNINPIQIEENDIGINDSKLRMISDSGFSDVKKDNKVLSSVNQEQKNASKNVESNVVNNVNNEPPSNENIEQLLKDQNEMLKGFLKVASDNKSQNNNVINTVNNQNINNVINRLTENKNKFSNK